MPRREGYQNAMSFTMSLCLIFTLSVAVIRSWIRKHAYGVDDAVIGAATITSLGCLGASYASYAAGLGKPWIAVQDDMRTLHQSSIASLVLSLVALYLSKCAMISFLGRITKTPVQIKLYQICNAAIATVGGASIIIATADCLSSSGYYWAFSRNTTSCPSQPVRWQLITILDCTTEALLVVLPVQLVWGLHMRAGRKAMIVFAFWIRIPTLALSLARNHFTSSLSHPDSDIGLTSALVNVSMEIELAYAIAASTLSALKTFTENFNTGFGVGQLRNRAGDSYGMSNGQAEKAKQNMSSFTNSESGGRLQPPPQSQIALPAELAGDQPSSLRLRPDRPNTETLIHAESLHGETGSVESAGSNEDMVIFRETAYHVQHDRVPMLPPCTKH